MTLAASLIVRKMQNIVFAREAIQATKSSRFTSYPILFRSLTNLRKRVVKIAAKVIAQARHAILQMAEAAEPRDIFRHVMAMINELRRRQVVRW